MFQRSGEPDFERFVTAIRGHCADRVPIAESLVDNRIKAAVLGRPILNLADDVAFWEKAGYDFVCLHSGLLAPGQTVSATRKLGVHDDYSARDEARIQWAAEGKGQIACLADVDAYTWPDVVSLVPGHLTEVAHYLPKAMKVVVTTGKLFTTAWQLMGFEAFCFAVYDDPALVGALFDRISHLQFAAYARMCEMETVGGFWFTDDVAHADGLMVSPKILKRYVFPWYARMVEMAHQSGKIAIYHSDGQLWKVLDDIIACGFDALHPIEPKAMDIGEVRRRSEGKLALIGNIDLHYPLTTGTPSAVRSQVRERILALAPTGGYLVGSSNSIPDWVPVENYLAMIQAAFDYGAYPILAS